MVHIAWMRDVSAALRPITGSRKLDRFDPVARSKLVVAALKTVGLMDALGLEKFLAGRGNLVRSARQASIAIVHY